ncbi:hypothetical protein GE061_002631 [Apolygus lucorum]|uniref:Trehalase n=1 Tax=Apolygus lucorum TaxID=248454 RepID=A0A6A4JLA8_APOLU|nr:hypothetical protein GE061_002631 [Apolygus lucorum]
MLEMFKFFVSLIIICIGEVIEGKTNDDYETSIFCYGRLLHDVQVHELFKHPRDFLELRARRPPQVISSRYREIRPKLKLAGEDGRKALKDFIRRNFVNRSSCENVSPPDWFAKPHFQRDVQDPGTLDFLKFLNRKWAQSYYNVTQEALENMDLHATIKTRHSFYGSSRSLNYEESWWLYFGLMSSGMKISARQLIENLAGLVDEYGHVPPENRLYFLGRPSPPFLAIMLEAYLNETGDLELAGRLLPYAEIDFHYWVQSTMRKVISAFDIYLVVNQVENFLSKPRPERYLEDWKRKPKNSSLKSILNVASLIWDSDPPRGTLSVRLTAITEWAARVLARLSQNFGGPQRRQLYSMISWELLHTMDTLLYSRKKKQWMDYSSNYGHVNDVSLWPVYTGARPWKSHYQVPRCSSLEEYLLSAVVLQEAGQSEAAQDVAFRALSLAAQDANLSLKNSSVAITLLRMFPQVQVPNSGAITPPVHNSIRIIVIPMIIATMICLPFLFIKGQISN